MKQLVNSGKILDATDFSRFKAALNNYRQEKLGSESITITDEDFVDIERVKAIISELNYNCENQQLIIKEYMKLIVGIAFDVWRSERRQIEKLHKSRLGHLQLDLELFNSSRTEKMIIDEDVRNRDLQEQLQKHNTKNFIEFIERFLGDKQLKTLK